MKSESDSVQMEPEEEPVEDLGPTESLALMGMISHSYVKYKDHALHFMQVNSTQHSRQLIPASYWDRLSFFRYYFNPISKLQCVFLLPLYFKEFVRRQLYWYLALISHNYIILFLTVYAPHEHFYVSKMIPMLAGLPMLKVFCTFFTLSLNCDVLSRILDYTLRGIVSRAPWNRQHILRFHKMHNFSLAPDYVWFYSLFVWATTILFYGQLFKKPIWRFFNYLVWILTVMYILTILYIELAILFENIPPKKYDFPEVKETQDINFDKLALFCAGPPILHLLYSRTKDEVNPGRESGLLAVSGMIFYIIQGLAFARLRYYCDLRAGISIQVHILNTFAFLYLYPMFFRSFVLGPLYTKIFFVFIFMVEYCTLVITYQTLIEVTICEWPRLKYWPTSTAISIAGFLFCATVSLDMRFEFYVVGNYSVIFLEIIAITYVYPSARLVEDINFYYYSDTVSKFRFISFQLMPWILFMDLYFQDYSNSLRQKPLDIMLFLVPIYGTAYYMTLTKGWSYLKRPVLSWGPPEPIVRLFRKQFDSKTFIDSLSPRFLSRHLLRRAEPPCYRLGVQYQEERMRRPGDLHITHFSH